MTYFISGHRDLTQEEFDEYYAHAIEDAIDEADNNYDECNFVVGDCRGCDEMAARFIVDIIKRRTEDPDDWTPCTLTIYHMFSKPRFRVGAKGEDGCYYVDLTEELNEGITDECDRYKVEDCPVIRYVGDFESDTERDEAMTSASEEDIAFVRNKSKWNSGTAQNLLRRRTMDL